MRRLPLDALPALALIAVAACYGPASDAGDAAAERRSLLRPAGPAVERPADGELGGGGGGRLVASREEAELAGATAGVDLAPIFRDPTVARFQPVQLDATAFEELPAEVWEERWQSAALAEELDTPAALDLERDFRWQRRLSGEGQVVLTGLAVVGAGLATLVKSGDQVVGDISYDDRTYAVRRVAGAEEYVLAELDADLLQVRLDREDDFGPAAASGGPASPPSQEERVDVLLATTEAASAGWWQFLRDGGLAPNTLESQLMVELENVNDMLTASGATSESVLRLAAGFVVQSGLVESGSNKTDALALATGAWGADLRRRRQEHRADLVVLVTGNADCGYAAAVGPAAERAFATVSWRCLHPAYRTFAHEIGHLLGARHEVEIDPELSPFPHQHGYHGGSGAFRLRTLMSYRCHGVATNCALIRRWSNPRRPWGAHATGRPGESDNAAVIRANLPGVAAFR